MSPNHKPELPARENTCCNDPRNCTRRWSRKAGWTKTLNRAGVREVTAFINEAIEEKLEP